MKKIIIILIILLLTGCYDYVEIDDLVIISGMLIDYQDNKYKITSQVIENESETKIKVFTTVADTIEECISEISKLSNKDIFISHLKVLILTEDLIKSNKDFYDFFLRDPKSKMNFYIYYVDNKYKDEILNIYKDDNGSSLYLKDLMVFNNKIFSSSTPVSFLDLTQRKMEYGIDSIYPNISIKENNNEKILYLENLVTFNNKNEKIILNDKNGIYYNMLINNIKKTIINIPCNNGNFSININNQKTKFKWKNNTFNINIKLTGKINSYNCKYDLNKSDSIKKLTNLTNNEVKQNVNKLINISKENKTDFIGIGNYIYKHDKDYFDFKNRNWNDNLKNIKIKINVDSTITSIGELRK